LKFAGSLVFGVWILVFGVLPKFPLPESNPVVTVAAKSDMMVSRVLFMVWLCALSGIAPFHCAAQAKKGDGFKLLFNGTNLNGFYIFLGNGPRGVDSNHVIQIEDRALHMYKGAADGTKQQFGYISTEREYLDYHLRFEYKWGTNRFGARAKGKRDAGVIYHMFGKDTVWPSGVECQVQEGDVGDIFTVNSRVSTTVDVNTTNLATILITNATTRAVVTNRAIQPKFLEPSDGGIPFVQGAATGIRRVIRNPMNEREGWNTVDLIVRSNSAIYIVNGKINNRVLAMERFRDDKWVSLTRGKIIFQLEGAEVFYRNIQIKDLGLDRTD
jgi:hypothetical protein